MKRILKKSSMLLCLALFAACSSDFDEPEPPQPEQQPFPEQIYPLTIEVTESPMTVDGEEGNNSRRTDIADNSSLTGFTMNYMYGVSHSTGSVTAEKSEEGKWTSEGSWPGGAVESNAEVSWYAYTGGTFNLNGGNPYINFTVDNDVAHQKDLLVATASGTWSGTGGQLTFAFDHACSALRFWVKKSTNINDHTLSVTSIVLKNVVNQGQYYYDTEGWTLTVNRADYTLFSGSAQILGSTDYIAMDGGTPCYLFMIPQTLTAWNPTGDLSNTYLQLTCSIDGGASQTTYIPFAATLEKGKKYNVKINIGKNSLYSGPNTKVITE